MEFPPTIQYKRRTRANLFLLQPLLAYRCNNRAMADEPEKKDSGLRGFAQAETILQYALSIPGGAFAGLAIGYMLDRHFYQNWIAVTLMLLGAAGGFYQLFYYLTKRGNK